MNGLKNKFWKEKVVLRNLSVASSSQSHKMPQYIKLLSWQSSQTIVFEFKPSLMDETWKCVLRQYDQLLPQTSTRTKFFSRKEEHIYSLSNQGLQISRKLFSFHRLKPWHGAHAEPFYLKLLLSRLELTPSKLGQFILA